MIHRYKNNGYSIVLDVFSGAVHVVDNVTYALIPILEEKREASLDELCKLIKEAEPGNDFSREEIAEAAEEIRELARNKTLYTEDSYENYVADFMEKRLEKPVVKALCLHVAHDCNLRCKYCFASEGEYHGKRALMSFETGKRALDFLVENSGNRRNLEVDFFGGEPLMNFEVVKALVEYGRSVEKEKNKNFRFTLTTNGVLLDDEVLDYVNREMGNLVLSIDGRKEVHDRMRPMRGGGPSHDRILPKLLKAAGSRQQKNYYVRGTFTHYNTDFAADVLYLNDLGFEQISVEPVVAPPSEDYALKESDLPVLMEQYDILAREILKRRAGGHYVNFFHFMIDLEGGPCVAKRLSGCGAGGEYLAVTPWGDLYPCHQFVGEERFLMGNVFDGVMNRELAEKFARVNVYSKPECGSCFARFYCSGGCAANSWHFAGDINGNYKIGCELERKRVECAIMIKAAEAEKE
ncbi:MAG: thioether cross-link-forming SCIFF peptide maturase [Lachnospiraceae bacterium]|nr:thioether cross-link-forming SCIFF peptide maturase [Lachnospiraceae bacterium]